MNKENLKQKLAGIAVFIVSLVLATATYGVSVVSAGAFQNPADIGGNVQVLGTCSPTVNNALITFAPVSPSYASTVNDPTTNGVLITDGGNTGSNVLVDGGNWVTGSLSFWGTNTVWNGASNGNGATGNQVVNQIVLGLGSHTTGDTQIALAAGGTVNLYFGVNVPADTAAGTYVQNLNIITNC
jgi:hypothetical protein